MIGNTKVHSIIHWYKNKSTKKIKIQDDLFSCKNKHVYRIYIRLYILQSSIVTILWYVDTVEHPSEMWCPFIREIEYECLPSSNSSIQVLHDCTFTDATLDKSISRLIVLIHIQTLQSLVESEDREWSIHPQV